MKNAILFSLVFTVAAVDARAVTSDDITALQDRWAVINYELPEKQRDDAFELLAEQAETLVAAQPDSAEAHIWTGIIYSTWAGQSGPFGAMKRAKKAKSELERALELSPEALEGSAYTSLGALLYQIPGVMGGDDEKAEAYLRKGIELNSTGIDANFFYAQFLFDQDRYQEAARYLDIAAEAPARRGRELADQGRQGDIASLKAKVIDAVN